jgi:hypothetical protein
MLHWVVTGEYECWDEGNSNFNNKTGGVTFQYAKD